MKKEELQEKTFPKKAENIDEFGNVLYLNEKMLIEKEIAFPRFKNKSNGIGFTNFLRKHVIYLSSKNIKHIDKLYHFIIKYSAWIKKGGVKSKLYKRAAMIYPEYKRPTSSVVMPLNVDITDRGEKVVVPMDMLKESLKNVTFIGGMDQCICRLSNKCKDYPIDFACLFLGEPARHIVKHNLGRELTYEEACARIDKAAELGLTAQAVWLEVEHWFWGIRHDEEDKFLEICFCCPCCCVGMRLLRNLSQKERYRFHPTGWTAVVNRSKCVGCKLCASEINRCPGEAIGFDENGKAVINQENCVGCGICTTKCKVGAIKIKQTMPMRPNLHEYFDKEFNIDLKIWKEEEK